MGKMKIERINLLPEDVKMAKKKAKIRPIFLAVIIFYILACGVIYIYQGMEIRDNSKKASDMKNAINAINMETSRYREIIEQVDITQKKKKEINKRIESVGAVMKGYVKWSDILKEITHIIPDDVWLYSLSTHDMSKEKEKGKSKQGRGMKFAGTALSNKMIARLIASLEDSLQFKEVSLQYSQKREVLGKDFYDFEILAELKGTEL